MPGVFDIGSGKRDELIFRFETVGEDGLSFNIFLGPGHQQILKHYHEKVGFPIRVPDWAFLHWLWRDELSTGPTGMLGGHAINAEIADDMLMYERFSIPSGAYLFDRPYLIGAKDPDS